MVWNNSEDKVLIAVREHKVQKPQISQNEILCMHDDFTYVFSIPVKFEIYFLGLLCEIVFGVITDN